MSLPGTRLGGSAFSVAARSTAVTAPGTLGAPAFRIAMLRLPATAVPADRGKNHDPAATTPDLASASCRAEIASRPLRAAARGPAARLDPISARHAS